MNIDIMYQTLSQEQQQALAKVCLDFVNKHRITCPESIYQVDSIIVDSTTLVEEICNVVGYVTDDDEE